ncbi:MAG: hypothetical protein ACRDA8_00605 [Shewanella sp.]
MNKSTIAQAALTEFAEKMTDNGFTVYLHLSTQYNYGVYTRRGSDRCVYFQFDIFQGFLFSSRAKPSREGGTGYRIDEIVDIDLAVRSAEKMLNSVAPCWVNHKYEYLTIDQYLAANSRHSKYVLFGKPWSFPTPNFNDCK